MHSLEDYIRPLAPHASRGLAAMRIEDTRRSVSRPDDRDSSLFQVDKRLFTQVRSQLDALRNCVRPEQALARRDLFEAACLFAAK